MLINSKQKIQSTRALFQKLELKSSTLGEVAHLITRVNLWANLDPVTSDWHFDLYDNFLLVLIGKKTVHLERRASSGRILSAKTLILQSRQVVRIPEGVWHKVSSDPETIALNFWMKSNYGSFVRSQKQFLNQYKKEFIENFNRRFLGKRDLIGANSTRRFGKTKNMKSSLGLSQIKELVLEFGRKKKQSFLEYLEVRAEIDLFLSQSISEHEFSNQVYEEFYRFIEETGFKSNYAHLEKKKMDLDDKAFLQNIKKLTQ